MKLIISLFYTLIVAITIQQTYAGPSDSCFVDETCDTLFCPNTLPPAIATVAYDETLTLSIPDSIDIDTSAANELMIDLYMVRVKNVSGVPSLFTAIINNGVDSIMSEEQGCVRMYGKPERKDTGTYKVGFGIEIWSAPIYSPIPPYVQLIGKTKVYDDSIKLPFVINDSAYGASIGKVQLKQLNLQQNYPNPFNASTQIVYTSEKTGQVTFRVMNMLGVVVHTEDVQAYRGLNSFTYNGKALKSGVYFYQLVDGKKVTTRRMIKN